MSLVRTSIAAAVAAASLSSFASAATLFSDAAESLTNFTVLKDSADAAQDTSATVIDYGALGIPEAPRNVAGSTAKTGIQLVANKDATGLTTGINVVLGSTPVSFSGVHTFSFDAYMTIPTGAVSTTESMNAGTVRAVATDALIRNFRTARGASQGGAWWLLTGDNGNGTEDFRHLDNGTSVSTFADGTNATQAAKWNAAFTNNLGGVNDEPANEWVKVDIVQDGTTNSVYFNGVLFNTITTTNSSGFAWFGYEDQFSSIGTVGLSGIFDNITVVEGNAVPEPTTLAALAGLGGLAIVRRRKP